MSLSELKERFRKPTVAELELIERFGRLKPTPARERAFEAFAETGLPSRRTEAWRWTDLKAGLRSLEEGAQSDVLEDPFKGVKDATLLSFSDDGFTSGTLPEGVRIIEQDEPAALGGAEDMPVAALAAALASGPGAVLIEVSQSPDAPIHLVFKGKSAMQMRRVSVVVRDDVSVQVMESHLGGGGFSSTIVEYGLQTGARVDRYVYQAGLADSVDVITGTAHLSGTAHFNQRALSFGSRLARIETRVSLNGADARADIGGAYLIGPCKHTDMTSLVRHSAADCVTRQLTRGAVKDEGRATFQGKFFVARQAQKTDAEMAHDALILENGAEVNAKPELEIYADDVVCAHGNTVGAIDTSALFYMRQRGIPEKEAKAMLTEAFVVEALDSFDDGAIADIMRERVQAWLTDNL